MSKQKIIGKLDYLTEKAVCINGTWYSLSSRSRFGDKIATKALLEPYKGSTVEAVVTDRWLDDIKVVQPVKEDKKQKSSNKVTKNNENVMSDIKHNNLEYNPQNLIQTQNTDSLNELLKNGLEKTQKFKELYDVIKESQTEIGIEPNISEAILESIDEETLVAEFKFKIISLLISNIEFLKLMNIKSLDNLFELADRIIEYILEDKTTSNSKEG